MKDIANLRKDYNAGKLLDGQLLPDPLQQFSRWFDEAVKAGVDEPNAMTLATVDAAGNPDARIVLLKGIDEKGLQFFTNYNSGKGSQLATSPGCCLVFFWKEIQRQVRIYGKATPLPLADNETYFRSRPRQSQLSALVSPQSSEVADRQVLEHLWLEAQATFEGKIIPLPENWGGFNVSPEKVEFWQGRPNRLHDRILYSLSANGWSQKRLAP